MIDAQRTAIDAGGFESLSDSPDSLCWRRTQAQNTSSNATLKDPDLKICCDVSMNRHPQDDSRHHLASAWNGLILIFNLFLRDLG